MRTFFQRKSWTVIFSAVALTALILLSIGIKDLAFRPGLHFQSKGHEQVEFTVIKEVVDQFLKVPFWEHVMGWGALLVILVLVSSLLSPELRKRLLYAFLRAALITLTLLYLVQHHLLELPFLNMRFTQQAGGNLNNTDLPALPVFQPPHVPPFLSYILSLGVAALFIGFVIIGTRWWIKQNPSQTGPFSLDDIAVIARSSLNDISEGQDWENVIFNCYARMSQVASAKQGLRRHESMTPTEFATQLENAGLPVDAVHRLTRLFESARYGGHKSTQKEIDEAIHCLTAILHHCGESA